VWVHGPDAEPWEGYTVLADADTMTPATDDSSLCCSTAAVEPVALTTKTAAC
jgi:hypothetical protein